jgi:hypothetical protein
LVRAAVREVGEFADVLTLDGSRLMADLTTAAAEPDDELGSSGMCRNRPGMRSVRTALHCRGKVCRRAVRSGP